MNLAVHSKHLLETIDALSLRERLFVFAAVLMVMGGVWEATLAGPLAARKDIARNQIAAAAERLAQLDETIVITASGMDGGLTNEQVDRVQALRQQVTAQDETVRVFTTDLIDPGQMRFVIEDLIQQHAGLELVRASNIPVESLIDDKADDAASRTAPGSELYRHGLAIELEGNYLSLLKYLNAIERLPWRIYWGRLDLKTLDYPTIQILIELHTLSLDAEWIGV